MLKHPDSACLDASTLLVCSQLASQWVTFLPTGPVRVAGQ